MGLCFGGGQIGLGLTSLALGLIVLRGMKWLERRLQEQKLGSLIATAGPEAPAEEEIRAQLAAAGMNIIGCAVRYTEQGRRRRLCYALRYHARSHETQVPPLIARLAQEPGMEGVEWCPNNTIGEMHGDEAPA
jgi:putative Mg2+ transporter-C (MgtC) family protein